MSGSCEGGLGDGPDTRKPHNMISVYRSHKNEIQTPSIHVYVIPGGPGGPGVGPGGNEVPERQSVFFLGLFLADNSMHLSFFCIQVVHGPFFPVKFEQAEQHSAIPRQPCVLRAPSPP